MFFTYYFAAILLSFIVPIFHLIAGEEVITYAPFASPNSLIQSRDNPKSGTADAAKQQVIEALTVLSKDKGTFISPPAAPQSHVLSQLSDLIKKRNGKPVTVVYIAHLGSQGDVSTSASVLQQLSKNPVFKVSAACDPRSQQYVPKSLLPLCATSKYKDVDGFVKYAGNLIKTLEPDVVVSAHAFQHHYPNGQWKTMRELLDKRISDKVSILIDLHSFYAPAENSNILWSTHQMMTKGKSTGTSMAMMKTIASMPDPNAKSNGPLSAYHLHLIGQQPEFWGNPSPGKTGSVMIGKLATMASTSGAVKSGPVFDFIKKAHSGGKKVMYLGFGGPHRPAESKQANPLLLKFVEANDAKDWVYILFHNAPKEGGAAKVKRAGTSQPASQPAPKSQSSKDGEKTSSSSSSQVFHLYYGEASLVDVFAASDLILHHGGTGTVSDCIAAGVPQIVIPNIASDQTLQGMRVEEQGLGLVLQPVQDQQNFKYDTKTIQNAFAKIVKDYAKFKSKVGTQQAAAAKFSGAGNAMDIIVRLSEGLLKRKIVGGLKRRAAVGTWRRSLITRDLAAADFHWYRVRSA